MNSTALDLRKFVVPECVIGADARRLAGNYAVNLGARKVLVVTDPGVMAAGWTEDVVASIERAGVPCTLFHDVTSNPRAEEVMAGAEIYLGEHCNSIIAVGGGSPIDCAKGIGIVSTNNRHILEFEGVDKVRSSIPPMVCIPTTGGASADVSQFAIINDSIRQVKIAIISKTIVPDVSLVDPITLTSMPSNLTAETGIDTLTHAFEAYVSNAQSALTDICALEATRLMSAYLPKAIGDPLNVEVRQKTAVACLCAGFAFSNAGLGLVHAMAHSLGGVLPTAHGEFNAILLPEVVSFNFASAAQRYQSLGEAMGLDLAGKTLNEVESALTAELKRFADLIGLGGNLGAWGISRGDIPQLAAKAMDDPDIATNARQPDMSDIEGIYERLF